MYDSGRHNSRKVRTGSEDGDKHEKETQEFAQEQAEGTWNFQTGKK